MIFIKVKKGQSSIEYSEPLESGRYPKLISPDKYKLEKTRSERVFDAITHLCDQVCKMESAGGDY